MFMSSLNCAWHSCGSQECYSVKELAEVKEHFIEEYEKAEVLFQSLPIVLSCFIAGVVLTPSA